MALVTTAPHHLHAYHHLTLTCGDGFRELGHWFRVTQQKGQYGQDPLPGLAGFRAG